MAKGKDHLTRRCPRLGGPVSFRYCRLSSGENRPCFKIFDCWWESFDVVSHMKSNLPEEQFEELLNDRCRPKPKLSSLVELIQQAKDQKAGD
ncbi:MAG TPA: hypothetical protein HPQ03_15015 [Deltaproteobacteria bacterium]|nr:hypothetical protein [Deltaproteobacteria bacterium]